MMRVIHTHRCPECGTFETCSAKTCTEQKTEHVEVLCEPLKRMKRKSHPKHGGKFLVQALVNEETLLFVKREAKKEGRSVSNWLRSELEALQDSPGVIRRNRKK